MKNDSHIRAMRALLTIAAAALLAACASIGRPEGGARDMMPPVFVSSSPMPSALNAQPKKITVTFDENIQLDDPSNKIIISPPQTQPPRISSNGRRVTLELVDTLLPNTTYTVDFADAVKDLNEGNILEGFAIDFSTGPDIDTLAISGMVLEGHTLEPAQGFVVGLYPDSVFTDTTLTRVEMMRVTKTDQLGRFTLRNLKPGNYRVFALNDMNRDYRWDRSEDVAFLPFTVSPHTEASSVTDTITAADGSDSLVIRPVTLKLPNDLLLEWFNEGYSPRYLVKNERPVRNRLELEFAAPADSLPELATLDGRRLRGLTESNSTRDTVTVWLTDTTVAATDSLRLSVRYQFTDSTDAMSWRTDTLNFYFRAQKKTKKSKNKEQADTLGPQPVFASFVLGPGSNVDLTAPLTLTAETPLAHIDTAGITLEMLVDTIWTTIQRPDFAAIDSTLSLRHLQAPYQWEPNTKYRLTVDSAAVEDIFGHIAKGQRLEFQTRAVEDYAALFFTITGLPDSSAAVVELLRSDTPFRQAEVNNGQAAFEYLMPGTYYARLYLDRDSSGTWTQGDIMSWRMPEPVYYYPKKINLKKNWDVEQAWDLNATPVDLQKPLDIKKNKPKKKKWDDENNPQSDQQTNQEDELWDTYSRDPFFERSRRNR